MPESDPSDGEINDVNEFLREIDNIERDETLVDLVGQGYDVNAPGDQDVADLLGAWRDDVGAEPVAWPNFPSAHTASGTLPPASTGGTAPMTNVEKAGQLDEMSHGEHIQATAAALTQADVKLGELAQQALTVVSEGQSHDLIQGAIQQLRQGIADLTGLLGATQQTFVDAAARMRNV